MSRLLIGVSAWYNPKYQCIDSIWRLKKPDGIDQMDLYYGKGYQAAATRNDIVEYAQLHEYDYILFVDADQIMLRADTVEQLLIGLRSVNKGFIIAAISRQNTDNDFTNVSVRPADIPYDPDADFMTWYPTFIKDMPQRIVETTGIGYGTVLCKTELFDMISRPYFQWVEPGPDTRGLPEDGYCNKKIHAAGIPIYAHGLIRVGHIKEKII